MRNKGILFALLLALPSFTGKAAAAVIDNPATAAEGLKTAVLTEQWRTGGEDSDVIFGNLSAAEVDADGNVILLDTQLSQALVIVGALDAFLNQQAVAGDEAAGEGDPLEAVCYEMKLQ